MKGFEGCHGLARESRSVPPGIYDDTTEREEVTIRHDASLDASVGYIHRTPWTPIEEVGMSNEAAGYSTRFTELSECDILTFLYFTGFALLLSCAWFLVSVLYLVRISYSVSHHWL